MIRHSVCPHDCPSTCALEVEVLNDNRIGAVRGADSHPARGAGACADSMARLRGLEGAMAARTCLERSHARRHTRSGGRPARTALGGDGPGGWAGGAGFAAGDLTRILTRILTWTLT